MYFDDKQMRQLEVMANRYVLDSSHWIQDNISDIIDELSIPELIRLETTLTTLSTDENHHEWNKAKLSILLALLETPISKEIDQIPTELEDFLAQTSVGWQDDNTYRFRNPCLRYGQNCRPIHHITDSNYSNIDEMLNTVFLDPNYGTITSHLFAYCLTALFVSRLKANNLPLPMPLHVSCSKNSNVYRLIEIIDSICDVNVPVPEICPSHLSYGPCDDVPLVQYPTHNTSDDLHHLMQQRDVPIIVAGFNAEPDLDALLKAVANQSADVKPLGLSSNLNTLPLFVSESLPNECNGISYLNLDKLRIDTGYLETLMEYRPTLASWTQNLLVEAKDSWFKEVDAAPRFGGKQIRFVQSFNRIYSKLYGSSLARNVSRIELRNITTLMYFFSKFLDGAMELLRVDTPELRESFVDIRKSIVNKTCSELIDLCEVSIPSLDINESVDEDSKEHITCTGIDLFERAIAAYKDYGVYLKSTNHSTYKNGRYVFPVVPLPKTNMKLLQTHANVIGRILEVPYFRVSVTPSSIELIFSTEKVEENSLVQILESSCFTDSNLVLPYAVGYDTFGDPVVVDITEFPHALVGGTTGSGKSSALHSLIMSLVTHKTPDSVKLMLMDFGLSGLDAFKDTPHSLTPGTIISQPNDGLAYLIHLKGLMEERENILSSLDIEERERQLAKLPSVVLVIDEFPALTSANKVGSDAVESLQSLLERGRKLKIHVILATQDATKARVGLKGTNLPTRLAFRCTNHHDSSAILGTSGAEGLSDVGSMYFRSPSTDPKFIHGSFIPPTDIPGYLATHTITVPAGGFEDVDLCDPLGMSDVSEIQLSPVHKPWQGSSKEERMLIEIGQWMAEGFDREKDPMHEISANKIKQRFHVSASTAKRYIESLQNAGVVSPPSGTRSRQIDRKALEQFLQRGSNVDHTVK